MRSRITSAECSLEEQLYGSECKFLRVSMSASDSGQAGRGCACSDCSVGGSVGEVDT